MRDFSCESWNTFDKKHSYLRQVWDYNVCPLTLLSNAIANRPVESGARSFVRVSEFMDAHFPLLAFGTLASISCDSGLETDCLRKSGRLCLFGAMLKSRMLFFCRNTEQMKNTPGPFQLGKGLRPFLSALLDRPRGANLVC